MVKQHKYNEKKKGLPLATSAKVQSRLFRYSFCDIDLGTKAGDAHVRWVWFNNSSASATQSVD